MKPLQQEYIKRQIEKILDRDQVEYSIELLDDLSVTIYASLITSTVYNKLQFSILHFNFHFELDLMVTIQSYNDDNFAIHIA